MTFMAECLRIPEVIDNIISFLRHNDRLACLQVNSTWNKLATPYVVRQAIQYLGKGFYSPHLRLQECKEAQESLRRNLGYVQSLDIYQPTAVQLFVDSDELVNLTKLYYGAHQQDVKCTTQVLDIIRKNPGLQSVAFYGSPFHGPNGISVERLIAALHPLTHLTDFQFKAWTDFNLADVKLLLDTLPKASLKSLRMKVKIQDDNLYGNVKALESGAGNSGHPYIESGTTAPLLGLETLSIVMEAKGTHDDATMLYRPLVFPVLRRCPNLKCLSVSALEKEDISELSVILQKTCPLIKRLKFNSTNADPDERACTDLILSSPSVKRIKSWYSRAWDMTEFVPRIIRHQEFCLRIEELYLQTTHGPRTSEWMQRLFCSLPNLRVYKQNIDPDAKDAAHLNICDMVRTRWCATKLEKLYLAIGSPSDWPEEEAETGAPETLERRKCKIRQVYQQFGALTQLKELGIRYDIQKESPVHFDMTIKTGLKAMRPCMSSLRFLDILELERCRIGRKELEWMGYLGLTHGGVLYQPDSVSEEEYSGSDGEYMYVEDSESDDD